MAVVQTEPNGHFPHFAARSCPTHLQCFTENKVSELSSFSLKTPRCRAMSPEKNEIESALLWSNLKSIAESQSRDGSQSERRHVHTFCREQISITKPQHCTIHDKSLESNLMPQRELLKLFQFLSNAEHGHFIPESFIRTNK